MSFLSDLKILASEQAREGPFESNRILQKHFLQTVNKKTKSLRPWSEVRVDYSNQQNRFNFDGDKQIGTFGSRAWNRP